MRTRVMITKERFAEAMPDLNWLVEHRASDAEPLRDRGLVNLKLDDAKTLWRTSPKPWS